MASAVTIKQHDTWPPLSFRLTDASSAAATISKAASTVTVTTQTNHRLSTGDYVYLDDTVNFSDNIARSVTVTGPRSFTYTDADSSAKATETATATAPAGTVARGVDLTSAVAIRIIAKTGAGGQTVVVTGGCTKDPSQTTNRGKGTYTWASGDTATTGSYDTEFEVNWGGTPVRLETFPNAGYLTITIAADLG